MVLGLCYSTHTSNHETIPRSGLILKFSKKEVHEYETFLFFSSLFRTGGFFAFTKSIDGFSDVFVVSLTVARTVSTAGSAAA